MSVSPLMRFVMAIGEPDFAQKAVAFLNTQVKVDHVALFSLDHELIPHFLGAASKTGSAKALLAGRLYERSMFYRHDPNAQRISDCMGEHEVMLFRQRATDIRDPGYRDRLYRRFNLLERMSLVGPVNGRWFTFNVYREVDSGPFDAGDTDVLSGLAEMLVNSTAKHVALTTELQMKSARPQSRAFLESLLGSIEPRLTPRERHVCSLALMGHSMDVIAVLLGIRQSTAATLRRRAYSKLGITKLSGLFALCIEKISAQNDTVW